MKAKWAMPLAIVLGAAALIGGTGLTVSSAWLITMAAQHPPILVLGVSIVLVRFFGISRSVARYGERVISHEAIFLKLSSIRREIFTALAGRLNKEDIAGNVKSAIDDVERAQEYYLRITLPQFAAAISGATVFLIAYWIEPSYLFVVIPLLFIYAVLIPLLTHRLIDPIALLLEDGESDYARSIGAASQASIEAEVYGYGELLRKQLHDATESLRQAEAILYKRISALQAIAIFSLGAALAGSVWIGYSQDAISAIDVSMSIFLLLVGFEGYTTWFPNLFIAGKNRRATQRVDELRALPQSEPTSYVRPKGLELELKGCSAFWDHPIVAPISVKVSRGDVLVISGPSGVGKSTLAAALFGFAPYEGSITVGGIEVSNLETGVISGTLQGGHIFNTTLRENLRIGNPDASDAELQAIVDRLELSSISLDELLGEFGRAISGGEAKRVSIARALLSQAPILILDEPLEHLDSSLSERVQKVINDACRERILIVITHAAWLQYSHSVVLTRE